MIMAIVHISKFGKGLKASSVQVSNFWCIMLPPRPTCWQEFDLREKVAAVLW